MPTSTTRTALTAVGGLLLLLVVVGLAAPLWLGPLAQRRLVQLVDERSRGQYALEVGDLDVGLFSGSLAVRDVALAPVDSAAVRSAAAALTGGLVLDAAAERIALTGVSYWALFTGGRLAADSLVVAEPRVLATAYPGTAEPAGSGSADVPLDPAEGKSAVSIDGVRLSGGRLSWAYALDSAAATLEASGVDVLVRDVALDSFAVGERLSEAYGSFEVRVGGYRHELPDSLHVVTLGTAAFDSRGGRLTLDSLRVRPRVAGFGFRQNLPDARLALEVTSDSLTLAGFDLGRFLRTGEYRARSLRVGETAATAWVDGSGGGGGGAGGGGIGLDLAVDTVDLRGVSLGYRSRAPALRLDLADADVLLTGVRTPSPNGPPFDVAEAELRFRDFAHAPPDGGPRVRVAGGRLDYRGGSLRLDGVAYGPVDEAAAARDSAGTLAVAATRVTMARVDLDRLFWDRALVAREVDVAGLAVRATSNLRVTAPSGGARPLLLERLQALPLPLAIDELAVTDAQVTYRRIGDASDVTLAFAQTYATFYHLGTTPAYARAHPRCEVDIRTRFNGLLGVRVGIGWPNARGVPYRLEASTGALEDLRRVNDFLVPMANLRVEDGSLRGLTFAWTADGRAGSGSLTASYADFAVDVLESGRSTDDRDVVSLLADWAAVRDDADGREAEIAAAREPGQGMFAHWWALVRSGLQGVALTGVGQRLIGE